MENSFEEIFNVELDCWCYGISHTNEKVDQRVIHQVIKSFSPVIHEAIEHLYVIDIAATAKKILKSSKCKTIQEKEIAFSILSQLPMPAELSREQYDVLITIVNQVEDIYAGAFSRLQKKWKSSPGIDLSLENIKSPNSNLENLCFPSKLK